MSKKSTMMTEGAIWKEILFFSIPLILGNLFQQLYNTVDSIIVGNWIGSEALAAVGSSGAIINLLLGFCIGASAGAGVVVSQFFGAGNREGVRKAVHTTLAICRGSRSDIDSGRGCDNTDDFAGNGHTAGSI